MNPSTSDLSLARPWSARLPRYALLAGLLAAVVAVLIFYRGWTARPPAAPVAGAPEVISAGQLEARYGLRVRLIGVSAGGGMIDFRLKIIDVDKSRDFMQDPAHLPRLIAVESDTTLPAPGGLDEDIPWEEGGILFFLVPNSGGAIRPGSPVSVDFGDVQLEPIIAQ